MRCLRGSLKQPITSHHRRANLLALLGAGGPFSIFSLATGALRKSSCRQIFPSSD
jgi:hypothetical protein